MTASYLTLQAQIHDTSPLRWMTDHRRALLGQLQKMRSLSDTADGLIRPVNDDGAGIRVLKIGIGDAVGRGRREDRTR